MRALILGFAGGCALLQQQAGLPPVALLVVGLVAALFAAALELGRADSSGKRIILLAVCGTVAGFAWAALVAHVYLARELPVEWEGRDVVLVGTIDSLPHHFERGVRFNFRIEQVNGQALPDTFPSRVALSWHSAFRYGSLQAVGAVRPGERWRLNVRLRRPHGLANPHGFDYEAWLLEQNLRATGYVRPDRRLAIKNERLDRFVPGARAYIERARESLRERIYSRLPQHEYAGVIVALVIGDQRAIDQSDWEVFNRTGIGHLISISGLHVTMIAGLVAALAHALWRRSFFITRAALPLVLPARKVAALVGAFAAFFYVLLAGFGVPAQRTFLMLAVVALALWTGRLTSVSYVLCLALGVVLLLDPWAVLQPGFWLSFSAVGLILLATTGRSAGYSTSLSLWQRLLQTLRGAARVQYAITLGLVPLTMLLFAQVSLVSPLANAIAIPLVAFFVTPAALVGSVLPLPLGAWVLEAGHAGIWLLANCLIRMSAWPGAVWTAPAPPWWVFLLALVGTIWVLAPRGWPARGLGVVLLVPLLVAPASAPGPGQLWVTALDVGQGNALLIETASRRLLYDTGPAYSPESDAGGRVLLPYLRGRGINRLDGLIVSHGDTDHAGGAATLLDALDVGWMSSSLPAGHELVQRAPQHVRCEAGQSWEWDGVRFEMLFPVAAVYRSSKWKPNARSCTLKVSVAGRSILLPGDIEALQEGYLIGFGAERLRADILLAPHHGSGTSSSLPFLQAVRPQFALFQVGHNNRYGHPKQEIYDRYGQLGAIRLRTDETGAIFFRLGQDITVTTQRQVNARYWHGR